VTSTRGAVPGDASPGTLPPLEVWAGVECTINRVGDRWRDQLEAAGHYERPGDVARIASLGVRTVRWPVLWERHHDNPEAWAHTDRVLSEFRTHGIRVIAGLVHHGSGPRGTHLLHEGFAGGLAAFARTVAERYPWLDAYTPVNEPLTTARFSALYGVWYPHARHDRAFVQAMLTQIRATQAAMAAVQSVNPRAELVATEDLGYTHVNPALRYQAAFENERRWLTWDLLQGMVRRDHPMWKWLTRSAPVTRALDTIAAHAANPALTVGVIGVNHYVTSERFLDEALQFYPPRTHGGNRWHRYADVEAVRVLRDGPLGPAQLLLQAWRRYGVPLAITEAHLGCTREQQMRWLAELWNAARDARAAGAAVRAVTPWALFGSFDWNSLLAQENGQYESGAWDVRAPLPHPTGLVPMIRSLATTGRYSHPALQTEGWWAHPRRLEYPPRRGVLARTRRASMQPAPLERRPLLVVGAHGTLGSAFRRLAGERGWSVVALSRAELDVTDGDAVQAALAQHRPWALVNAAGWVRVDDAEHEREACLRTNVHAAELLATAAAAHDVRFCTFSSDLVFGDEAPRVQRSGAARPFVESDVPAPQNWYGHSKATAEGLVQEAHGNALIVRTSAFFGDWDDWNFVSRALAALHRGDDVMAPHDAIVSPTYVRDLVHASLDLLVDEASGVWHLANVGACSWYELACEAAEQAGFDRASRARITPCGARDIGWTAPRPSYSALASERATLLPSLDDALQRHLRARAWERVARHPSFRNAPMRARSHT
jgi:dTDP-4-dehydrorhamnose reductase